MSDTAKKPIDPSKLGELYPTAKTYAEVQTERDHVQRLRQSWLPKYPKLLIVCIIIGLMATAWLIIAAVAPMMSFSIMTGVFGALLLFLLWVYAFIAGLRKIHLLLDQITATDK